MTNKKNIPAVLGGSSSVTKSHDEVTKWPMLTSSDLKAVEKVLNDGNISTHHVIRDIEEGYKKLTGRKYALSHNNGTSALLASFFTLGLKPGDEVLVPSATFWATVVPMLWLGALPVFCESENERLGIDPVDMKKKITARTKAIVTVHLWGLPCKMTEIYELAKKHNLAIIEDASHAHGAKWKDKPCGTLGDISVFSLQGDKLAPSGEGGMLLTDNYQYYERATCLGDITRIIELKTPARRFAATSFGLKTRMSPLSAAIGLNQLGKLEEHNKQRNSNLRRLSEVLEGLGFNTFLGPTHTERTYFEYLIHYDEKKHNFNKEHLVDALTAEGCIVESPRYPLLHQQPIFTEGAYKEIARLPSDIEPPDYLNFSLPITEANNNMLLKLPSFPGKDNGIIDEYIEAFSKVMKNKDAIQDKLDNA